MKNKILIIEDDMDLCEVLTESFEDEGYAVQHVHDGISGKQELMKNNYDLLLLDIKIPGITGFDILGWLKETGKKIKTIVLTGMPLNDKITRYLRKDISKETELLHFADAVLNKPFKTDVLIGVVKTLGLPAG